MIEDEYVSFLNELAYDSNFDELSNEISNEIQRFNVSDSEIEEFITKF